MKGQVIPYLWHMAAKATTSDPREEIGEELKVRAAWVYDRLTLARQLGSPLDEETITQTLLIDMAAQLGPLIRIESFTKSQEAKQTGADWEWWFCDGEDEPTFGLRVQAKKLQSRASGPFYDFDYVTPSTGKRQIDRLIESADRDRLPAVYALYNGPDLDLSRFQWNCCSEPPDEGVFGVSLVAADSARNLADIGDTSLELVGDLSRPWSCSALCPNELQVHRAVRFWPAGGNLSLWAADLTTELYVQSAELVGRSPRQRALDAAMGYRTWSESPSYVRRLVERTQDEIREPAESLSLPEDVSGVTAFIRQSSP